MNSHTALAWMFALAAVPIASTAAVAEDVEGGTLNPEELTIQYYIDNPQHLKKEHGYVCWYGYEAHKSGDHVRALKIFDRCAENGNHAAMMFMSHIFDNGLAVERDPQAATGWVKRAAEEGYSVGQFNYGVALMRGHGTPLDADAGKAWIGRAAAQDDRSARTLIDSGYDLDVVTPDAEEKKHVY